MNILFKKVPNFKEANITPLAVCFHIGEGSQDIIYQTFLTEEKSSHYIIGEKGIWQCVSEKNIAWAQGNVINPTHVLVLNNPNKNPNEYLLSIENEGFGNKDIPEWQYWKNAELYENICMRYNWPVDREHCLRHREINALKICPGKIDLDKIVRYAQQIRTERLTQPIEKIELIKKQVSLIDQIVGLLFKLNFLKSMSNPLKKFGSDGESYPALLASSVDSHSLSATIKSLAVFVPFIVLTTKFLNLDLGEGELNNILELASNTILAIGTVVSASLTLFFAVRKILVKLNIY